MTTLKGNQGIEVGDVFTSIWGYEQTNASFYQVVRIVGKTMVEVQQINSKTVDNSTKYLTANVLPDIDNFRNNEKPFKKKVDHYGRSPSIRISSYATAELQKKSEGFTPINISFYA